MPYRLVYCLLALLLLSSVHGQNTTDPGIAEVEEVEESSCSASQLEEYSMPWHIGAIFIVLACSGIGIFFTLTLGTLAQKPIFARMLQICKMFGIGVIAATGWCHLIPDAFESFTSECLPEGWSNYGPAFVGVFALASSFIVQSIELALGGEGHSHGILPRSPSNSVNPPAVIVDGPVSDPAAAEKGKPPLRLTTEAHERSEGLSTMILEAGILFHSLIIGVSLGVTGDMDTFRPLLIAICFHQFFEGLALGSLIAKLDHSTIFKFLVMGLLYPLTTPIGMVIGILIRNSYNENSHGAILVEGIFNSLSAGILLYNTYAELLSTEVNHNKTFKKFSKGYKFANMMALYLGAASMAILAYWA